MNPSTIFSLCGLKKHLALASSSWGRLEGEYGFLAAATMTFPFLLSLSTTRRDR